MRPVSVGIQYGGLKLTASLAIKSGVATLFGLCGRVRIFLFPVVFEQNTGWKARLYEGRRTDEFRAPKRLNYDVCGTNPIFLVFGECQACYQREY
jgi:hypothetical protein